MRLPWGLWLFSIADNLSAVGFIIFYIFSGGVERK
jgi:hypothetical protein